MIRDTVCQSMERQSCVSCSSVGICACMVCVSVLARLFICISSVFGSVSALSDVSLFVFVLCFQLAPMFFLPL